MAQVIQVRVKPGSKKGPLVVSEPSGELTVFVRERAVDGKANQAVIAVLAEHFGVRRNQITLTSGMTARLKRFRID